VSSGLCFDPSFKLHNFKAYELSVGHHALYGSNLHPVLTNKISCHMSLANLTLRQAYRVPVVLPVKGLRGLRIEFELCNQARVK